jgi:hypothetical protein
MDCSCIKGESNFSYKLESVSENLVLFQDLSDWMDHPAYKNPSYYILNVTPPGKKEGLDISIDVNRINKLTSKEIFGQEGMSIPDGVYCLKVTNCGYTYTRYAAITYQLECCIDEMYNRGENTDELDVLMTQIKKAAEFQDSATASKLYRIAIQQVKQKNCNC